MSYIWVIVCDKLQWSMMPLLPENTFLLRLGLELSHGDWIVYKYLMESATNNKTNKQAYAWGGCTCVACLHYVHSQRHVLYSLTGSSTSSSHNNTCAQLYVIVFKRQHSLLSFTLALIPVVLDHSRTSIRNGIAAPCFWYVTDMIN